MVDGFARFHTLSVDPSTPPEGICWFGGVKVWFPAILKGKRYGREQ